MGFLDKAKAAATDLASKADGKLSQAGLGGPGGDTDRLYRELGQLVYREHSGQPADPAARERLLSELTRLEVHHASSAGGSGPPPPPGSGYGGPPPPPGSGYGSPPSPPGGETQERGQSEEWGAPSQGSGTPSHGAAGPQSAPPPPPPPPPPPAH